MLGQHAVHEGKQFLEGLEMCGLSRYHVLNAPGDMPCRNVCSDPELDNKGMVCG